MSNIIKRSFDTRYERLQSDKSRIHALIVYYGFLGILTVIALFTVPDSIVNIVMKFLGM